MVYEERFIAFFFCPHFFFASFMMMVIEKACSYQEIKVYE
jgi:hypothetical protein